ncbi:hypothetical protein HJA88_23270 [Rhizobium bangladeshense]|nr:hypothetical protein [Rhizobium bangladeshense]
MDRFRYLAVVQLLRQFGKKSVPGEIHLNEVYGNGDGAAPFDAVDVKLFLAAPLPNGVGDDGYFAVAE